MAILSPLGDTPEKEFSSKQTIPYLLRKEKKMLIRIQSLFICLNIRNIQNYFLRIYSSSYYFQRWLFNGHLHLDLVIFFPNTLEFMRYSQICYSIYHICWKDNCKVWDEITNFWILNPNRYHLKYDLGNIAN